MERDGRVVFQPAWRSTVPFLLLEGKVGVEGRDVEEDLFNKRLLKVELP